MEASARPDSLLSQQGFRLPVQTTAGSRPTAMPCVDAACSVRSGKIAVVRVRVVDVATGVHVPYVVRVRRVTISGTEPDVAR